MFKFLNIKLTKISNFQLKTAAGLIFLTISCFLLPPPAYGQTLSLSLWPPLLEVMMQPGRSITQVFQLTNNSEQDLLIMPQIFAFKPNGATGQIMLETNPSPVANFFSFESREKPNEPFLVKAGQGRQLVLKISVPLNNPEGDYYHTLLFSSLSTPALSQSSGASSSVIQIGSNILLTVSQTGKPPLGGKITQFSLPSIIDSFSPLEPTIILENTGRAFWKPFGEITLTGLFGQKKTIKLLEQNVLAYSSRQLNIEPFRPAIPLGPFKTQLKFTLNENGPLISQEISFWYLPYKVFGCLLVLIWGLIIVKKIAFFLKKKFTSSCFRS